MELTFESGHLITVLEGRRYLVDTGSPTSFGPTPIHLKGRRFEVLESHMGHSVEQLAEYVGCAIDGLIGADILNLFDVALDVPGGRMTLSEAAVACEGETLPLDFGFVVVPIITVGIDGFETKMFFDTGAPLSYFQEPSITQYEALGEVPDFYLGFGRFSTETYRVPMRVASTMTHLRCGRLPRELGDALLRPPVRGIVGNEWILARRVVYAARRRRLTVT